MEWVPLFLFLFFSATLSSFNQFFLFTPIFFQHILPVPRPFQHTFLPRFLNKPFHRLHALFSSILTDYYLLLSSSPSVCLFLPLSLWLILSVSRWDMFAAVVFVQVILATVLLSTNETIFRRFYYSALTVF